MSQPFENGHWGLSFALGIVEIRRDSFHKLEEHQNTKEVADRIRDQREKNEATYSGIVTVASALRRAGMFNLPRSKVHSLVLDGYQIWSFFLGAISFGLMQALKRVSYDHIFIGSACIAS